LPIGEKQLTINWTDFTPWSALAGGALIGLAAALFFVLNGRIAGISGIVGGLLSRQRGDVLWRVLFIAGMVAAPVVWGLFAELPPMKIDASYPMLIIAGLIVGISTRYGSGCTSGHGVCGIARLSPRSIVATLAFMASGFVTVYLFRHVISG
jgi:uncharacterized protein